MAHAGTGAGSAAGRNGTTAASYSDGDEQRPDSPIPTLTPVNDFLAQLREAGAHAKPYQIQGALGKGKFATVYKASLGSDLFALKKVAIFELMSESSRDKCLKEIQLLASLHHPNIIRYEDSYLDLATNELVIVLQWARGGDLKKLIRKVKGGQARIREFSEGMVWKYASELASALAYMHRKRIMHRDLKAANIMLSADNHLLLGDLGLSRFFNPQTMEAFSKVGTPLTIAPEVLSGTGYSFAADVWSLGCLAPDTLLWLADGRTVRADELQPHDRLLDEHGQPVDIVPNSLMGTRSFPMPPQPGFVLPPHASSDATPTLSPGWQRLRSVRCEDPAFDDFVCSDTHTLVLARRTPRKSRSATPVVSDDCAHPLPVSSIPPLPSCSECAARDSDPAFSAHPCSCFCEAEDECIALEDMRVSEFEQLSSSYDGESHLYATRLSSPLIFPTSGFLRGTLERVLHSCHSPVPHSFDELESLSAWLIGLWLSAVDDDGLQARLHNLCAAETEEIRSRCHRWLQLLSLDHRFAARVEHSQSSSLCLRFCNIFIDGSSHPLLNPLSLLFSSHAERQPLTPSSFSRDALLDSSLPWRLSLQTETPRNRLSLLDGMLDAACEWDANGSFQFTSSSENVAQLACTVARQLGWAAARPVLLAEKQQWLVAHIRSTPKLFQTLPLARISLLTQAASCRFKHTSSNPHLSAVSIAPPPEPGLHPVVSFQVRGGANTGRFLLADGQVTHNCVLYELCTLNSPFKPTTEGVNLYALFGNIRAGKFEPVPADGRYSEQLRTLISAMIRVDPSQRPSMQQVADIAARMVQIRMQKQLQAKAMMEQQQQQQAAATAAQQQQSQQPALQAPVDHPQPTQPTQTEAPVAAQPAAPTPLSPPSAVIDPLSSPDPLATISPSPPPNLARGASIPLGPEDTPALELPPPPPASAMPPPLNASPPASPRAGEQQVPDRVLSPASPQAALSAASIASDARPESRQSRPDSRHSDRSSAAPASTADPTANGVDAAPVVLRPASGEPQLERVRSSKRPESASRVRPSLQHTPSIPVAGEPSRPTSRQDTNRPISASHAAGAGLPPRPTSTLSGARPGSGARPSSRGVTPGTAASDAFPSRPPSVRAASPAFEGSQIASMLSPAHVRHASLQSTADDDGSGDDSSDAIRSDAGGHGTRAMQPPSHSFLYDRASPSPSPSPPRALARQHSGESEGGTYTLAHHSFTSPPLGAMDAPFSPVALDTQVSPPTVVRPSSRVTSAGSRSSQQPVLARPLSGTTFTPAVPPLPELGEPAFQSDFSPPAPTQRTRSLMRAAPVSEANGSDIVGTARPNRVKSASAAQGSKAHANLDSDGESLGSPPPLSSHLPRPLSVESSRGAPGAAASALEQASLNLPFPPAPVLMESLLDQLHLLHYETRLCTEARLPWLTREFFVWDWEGLRRVAKRAPNGRMASAAQSEHPQIAVPPTSASFAAPTRCQQLVYFAALAAWFLALLGGSRCMAGCGAIRDELALWRPYAEYADEHESESEERRVGLASIVLDQLSSSKVNLPHLASARVLASAPSGDDVLRPLFRMVQAVYWRKLHGSVVLSPLAMRHYPVFEPAPGASTNAQEQDEDEDSDEEDAPVEEIEEEPTAALHDAAEDADLYESSSALEAPPSPRSAAKWQEEFARLDASGALRFNAARAAISGAREWKTRLELAQQHLQQLEQSPLLAHSTSTAAGDSLSPSSRPSPLVTRGAELRRQLERVSKAEIQLNRDSTFQPLISEHATARAQLDRAQSEYEELARTTSVETEQLRGMESRLADLADEVARLRDQRDDDHLLRKLRVTLAQLKAEVSRQELLLGVRSQQLLTFLQRNHPSRK